MNLTIWPPNKNWSVFFFWVTTLTLENAAELYVTIINKRLKKPYSPTPGSLLADDTSVQHGVISGPR